MNKIEDNDSSASELDIPKADNKHIKNAAPNFVDEVMINHFLGASYKMKKGEKAKKKEIASRLP